MTLAQAVREAVSGGLDRLDAQLLLLHALGRGSGDRAWLLAHDGDLADPQALAHFRRMASDWTHGAPLAYLLGSQEFFGLRLSIDPRVLVPRPDTETLVEWALECLQPLPAPRVLDLGTGSGAIALALRHARPDATVTAVDSSPDALAVAVANGERLRLPVSWRCASWFDGLEADRFDAIVSNPPYIAEGDPHLHGLRSEPMQALVSGPDGLDAIRAIVSRAPAFLAEGGWLLLEHGWDQAPRVRALLAAQGFAEISSRKDIAGIERCSGGVWRTLG